MSKFSKKHYMAIAKAIAVTPDRKRNGVVAALVALFTADNAAFEADRFVAACAFNGVGADDPMRDADERRMFADSQTEES